MCFFFPFILDFWYNVLLCGYTVFENNGILAQFVIWTKENDQGDQEVMGPCPGRLIYFGRIFCACTMSYCDAVASDSSVMVPPIYVSTVLKDKHKIVDRFQFSYRVYRLWERQLLFILIVLALLQRIDTIDSCVSFSSWYWTFDCVRFGLYDVNECFTVRLRCMRKERKNLLRSLLSERNNIFRGARRSSELVPEGSYLLIVLYARVQWLIVTSLHLIRRSCFHTQLCWLLKSILRSIYIIVSKCQFSCRVYPLSERQLLFYPVEIRLDFAFCVSEMYSTKVVLSSPVCTFQNRFGNSFFWPIDKRLRDR